MKKLLFTAAFCVALSGPGASPAQAQGTQRAQANPLTLTRPRDIPAYAHDPLFVKEKNLPFLPSAGPQYNPYTPREFKYVFRRKNCPKDADVRVDWFVWEKAEWQLKGTELHKPSSKETVSESRPINYFLAYYWKDGAPVILSRRDVDIYIFVHSGLVPYQRAPAPLPAPLKDGKVQIDLCSGR